MFHVRNGEQRIHTRTRPSRRPSKKNYQNDHGPHLSYCGGHIQRFVGVVVPEPAGVPTSSKYVAQDATQPRRNVRKQMPRRILFRVRTPCTEKYTHKRQKRTPVSHDAVEQMLYVRDGRREEGTTVSFRNNVASSFFRSSCSKLAIRTPKPCVEMLRHGSPRQPRRARSTCSCERPSTSSPFVWGRAGRRLWVPRVRLHRQRTTVLPLNDGYLLSLTIGIIMLNHCREPCRNVALFVPSLRALPMCFF